VSSIGAYEGGTAGFAFHYQEGASALLEEMDRGDAFVIDDVSVGGRGGTLARGPQIEFVMEMEEQ
jgi:hypothetical protein